MSINTNLLDIENADVTKIVQSMINDGKSNRSERRRVEKALCKFQNRQAACAAKSHEESGRLQMQYQKELDERIEKCQILVDDGLSDNWKKLIALAGLTLKRKYNWSIGRVGNFIEKTNDLHKEMLASGEWDHILEALDKECDIQLEVTEE